MFTLGLVWIGCVSADTFNAPSRPNVDKPLKPSERIKEIMDINDAWLGLDTRNNMPMHGPLWALIQYLDEQDEQSRGRT